jgi:hypothetical protein
MGPTQPQRCGKTTGWSANSTRAAPTVRSAPVRWMSAPHADCRATKGASHLPIDRTVGSSRPTGEPIIVGDAHDDEAGDYVHDADDLGALPEDWLVARRS